MQQCSAEQSKTGGLSVLTRRGLLAAVGDDVTSGEAAVSLCCFVGTGTQNQRTTCVCVCMELGVTAPSGLRIF